LELETTLRGHYVSTFPTTFIKRVIFGGLCVLCEGVKRLSHLLLSKFLIFIDLTHFRFNLNFMFALSFGSIHLFEILVLVEGVKSDERTKVILEIMVKLNL